MLPLLRCLWSDVLHGWRESPGAPLSRAGVAALLAGVAAAVLLAFLSAQAALEATLRSFGDRTVVVGELRLGDRPRLHPALPALLAECGGGQRLHLLRGAGGVRAAGLDCERCFYDDEEAGLLPGLPDLARRPSLLLARGLPPGAEWELPGAGRQTVASAARPAWLDRFTRQPVLLAPASSARAPGDLATETTRIEAASPEAAARLAARLREVRAALGAGHAEVLDSAEIQERLAGADAARARWRWLLLAVLTPALALVLGTLSVLEFRQTQYSAALLRSQGVAPLLLWLRRLLEDAFTVGLAGGGVLLLMAAYAPEFLRALGTDTGGFGAAEAARFLWEDGRWLLAGLLGGAVAGSLPVAAALRLPVGRVLP